MAIDLRREFICPDGGAALWPHQAVEGATIALGRAAAAGLPNEDARQSLDHRDGRTVVDEAGRRHRGADPLIDEAHNFEDARALRERLDAVTDLHRRRRFF